MYFAAQDAQLVATRNNTWRLFDFFWMLHTMDYRGRDNFNNPLVITIATAALWLSLSGFLLVLRSFAREDFHLPPREVWSTLRSLKASGLPAHELLGLATAAKAHHCHRVRQTAGC